MENRREIWWLVALEAAVMFSLPTWVITDRGWPGVSAWPFALAVAVGAGSLTERAESAEGRVAQWVLRGWLCLGAAVAVGRLANLGRITVSQQAWRLPAWWPAVALVGFLAAPVALARWERGRRVLVVASLGIGVGLVISSLAGNVEGLEAKNPYWTSEEGKDRPLEVFQGMVMAAAPAAAVAVRLGRLGVTRRGACWTGFWGMWLPLVVSVAAMNVAKMWGTRVHWTPSLPGGVHFMLTWLVIDDAGGRRAGGG